MYETCNIFDRGRDDTWKTITVGNMTVGEVGPDEDEKGREKEKR